ncbi:MAG TPA: hypothetical protein PLR71_02885 [Deltaproteobacteria bacterium]|nr:hypothetical protein [Deltaproteobacteria bacterium]HQI80482.1 hypothetical protein [Deltaproteobacteria bacterium]
MRIEEDHGKGIEHALDRASVRGALAAIRGFQGVIGDITFDAHRNPVAKPTVIMRLDRGGSVQVKTHSGGSCKL